MSCVHTRFCVWFPVLPRVFTCLCVGSQYVCVCGTRVWLGCIRVVCFVRISWSVNVLGSRSGCGWSSGDTVGACSQVDACPGSPGFSAPKHTFGPGVSHPVHACTGPWGREGVRSLRVERQRGSAWSRPCSEGQGPPCPRACSSAPAPQTLLPPSPLPCCLRVVPLWRLLCLRSPQGVPKPPSFLPSPAPPRRPGAFVIWVLGLGHGSPVNGRRQGLSGQLRWLLAACVLEAWGL